MGDAGSGSGWLELFVRGWVHRGDWDWDWARPEFRARPTQISLLNFASIDIVLLQLSGAPAGGSVP